MKLFRRNPDKFRLDSRRVVVIDGMEYLTTGWSVHHNSDGNRILDVRFEEMPGAIQRHQV